MEADGVQTFRSARGRQTTNFLYIGWRVHVDKEYRACIHVCNTGKYSLAWLLYLFVYDSIGRETKNVRLISYLTHVKWVPSKCCICDDMVCTRIYSVRGHTLRSCIRYKSDMEMPYLIKILNTCTCTLYIYVPVQGCFGGSATCS